MMMRIGNDVIHRASVTAQRLSHEGRDGEAATIFALVDIAINLEVRMRENAMANAQMATAIS